MGGKETNWTSDTFFKYVGGIVQTTVSYMGGTYIQIPSAVNCPI